MRRKDFLLGVLSGAAVCAAAVWGLEALARSFHPPVTPRAERVVPRRVIVAPAGESAVPPGWQRRQFNGIEYYLVPLMGPTIPRTSPGRGD
jgi:hypothetical protein